MQRGADTIKGGQMSTSIVGKRTGEMLKTFVKLEALFVPLYFSFVMYYTFLSAYFNPNPFNMMWINRFGEAKFEFVLIPLCLLLSVAGVIVWLVEEIRKNRPTHNRPTHCRLINS